MSDTTISGSGALQRQQPLRRHISDAAVSSSMFSPNLNANVNSEQDISPELGLTNYEFDDQDIHLPVCLAAKNAEGDAVKEVGVAETADAPFDAKIGLLKKQLEAKHRELTAELVLAQKVAENPNAIRATTRVCQGPGASTATATASALDAWLQVNTKASKNEILASVSYSDLLAYCKRHGLQTPEQVAAKTASGKTLLAAIKDLIAAGVECEHIMAYVGVEN